MNAGRSVGRNFTKAQTRQTADGEGRGFKIEIYQEVNTIGFMGQQSIGLRDTNMLKKNWVERQDLESFVFSSLIRHS